jgi:hypothetical protein
MAISDYSPTQRTGGTGGISQYGATAVTTPTPTPRRGKPPRLTQVPELLKEAEKAGLQEQLAQRPIIGEDPEQFWSGGWIQDTFDTLNALQYGITGMVKGKSFAEGVRTRQSFSDKDALGDYGLPGVIAGIALDIAVDPLTYIAPWTIFRKIPGAVKASKAVLNAAAKTRLGNMLGRAFVYRFGQDPIYKALDERRLKNIGVGTRQILDIVRPMSKLSAKHQKVIGAARKAGKLGELPEDLLRTAKPAFDELDKISKQLVDEGLLKKEIYDETVGSYLPRLYRTKEFKPGPLDELVRIPFADTKPTGIDFSRFKKRTDISDEVREGMGEILEAGYPTAKGMTQMKSALENSKFFKHVNKGFATDEIIEGYIKLPTTPRLGELSGKRVPKPIYDSIEEIILVKTPAQKALGKVVSTFKFGKVILNPATHARNITSNFILNNFEGLNPATPGGARAYKEAAKIFTKKGRDTSKWYKEALDEGLGLSTYTSAEIRGFLDAPELNKLGRGARENLEKIADLYEKEEQFAKMAQFIYQRQTKGLSKAEAWKVAERATFNYAQVTPFIRMMRENIFGYPFITFSYKVTPQVAKTLAKRPTKISNIGKIKEGIENQISPEELKAERKYEPDWVRNGMYIALPMKDKYDRRAYLDLTYIMPFGDLVGGELFERPIKRESGLRAGLPESIARKLAFPSLATDLVNNEDFYGDQVFKKTDKIDDQIGDIMRHIMKMYLPPLVSDRIPRGYNPRTGKRTESSGIRTLNLTQGNIEQNKATRTLYQELLKNVGIKIQPLRADWQKDYAGWQEQRAITTILEEAGVLGKIPYIKKKR